MTSDPKKILARIRIVSMLCFSLSMLMSCGYQAKPAPQKVLTGINGEAIYIFTKDHKVWAMFKEIYNVPDYQVLLKSDTVVLGTNFVSTVNVAKQVFKVQITSPTAFVMSNENEFDKYTFVPAEVGTYDFKGSIEYDTTIAHFEYKFIVVDR